MRTIGRTVLGGGPALQEIDGYIFRSLDVDACTGVHAEAYRPAENLAHGGSGKVGYSR